MAIITLSQMLLHAVVIGCREVIIQNKRRAGLQFGLQPFNVKQICHTEKSMQAFFYESVQVGGLFKHDFLL